MGLQKSVLFLFRSRLGFARLLMGILPLTPRREGCFGLPKRPAGRGFFVARMRASFLPHHCAIGRGDSERVHLTRTQ
jgi:hypothetical protein